MIDLKDVVGNTIDESALIKAHADNAIKECHVNESRKGFYITVRKRYKKEPLTLTTRRIKDEPRYFKSAETVIDYINEHLSELEEPIILHLNHTYIPKNKEKKLREAEEN